MFILKIVLKTQYEQYLQLLDSKMRFAGKNMCLSLDQDKVEEGYTFGT